ncbi:MAG: glycosyl hydrolase-related protein [Carboxylicivirga sp.]|jgi:alpha-mannosidase|nr:glycosyl hydrolase-related protein [Carboxylicivirga sp.]
MKNENTCIRITQALMFIAFLLNTGIILAHESAGRNQIYDVNTNYELSQLSKNDIDGFSSQIGGGVYSYPSLRDDVREAMIARASTGKAGFEFYTSLVPMDHSSETVTFFFYSDADLNKREPYDIKVNGQHLLSFQADENGKLNISNQVSKADAQFYLFRRDGNGDGIGAFRLTVPVNMLEKGKMAKISVTGHAKGSNAWFMLFKVPNALKWLREAAKHDISFSIRQFTDKLLIDAPEFLVGKPVYLVSDGKRSKEELFKRQGVMAKASVKADVPMKSLKIVYDGQVYQVDFKGADGIVDESVVKGRYLYASHAHMHNGWQANLTRRFRPDFYKAYEPFFDNKYQKGLLSIMNSSHQDIAWVDRPEACIIMRDTLLLTPIIKDAFARKDYGFDIEDGLMLREYLERHPDAKDKLTELLNRKLLSVGATYNCPYEDMYDAEDLVRQLYLGKLWVKKNFGAYDSKVYWNVDVPGKSLQFPQILKKAGVDYMVISRHAKSMFHWQSPDGSSVFTYSPGHYGEDLIHLSKNMGDKLKYGAEQVVWWSRYFDDEETQAPLLSSQDMLPAIDYSKYIEVWNNTDSVIDENNKKQMVFFPHMELMTMDEYLPLAAKNATAVDTIQGERPNVWVYIHGPAHHDALTASRKASKLLPAAEKFLTIASLIDKNKMAYPSDELDRAWQAKIYPDHGWGGHDGDVTDNLFKEKLLESQFMADRLLDKATGFLAQRVKTNEKKGIPVILFNSLSWERTDPVTITLDFTKGEAQGLSVFNADKKRVPMQIASVSEHADGSIKRVELIFIAEDIPSLGYKTYYVRPEMKRNKIKKTPKNQSLYENNFYKISFDKGGIDQVYDKEFGRNLFTTKQFKVGEVFTLQSEGNGAGEFGDVQQPFMKNFDQVSKHGASWELVQDGDVYSKYRLTQQIRHAKVEQNVIIYHRLKRIQFENKLLNWDGELYREFRTAYPVAIKNSSIKHEVPFGTVEVGKDEINSAGERYTPLCKDVHPRAIMDWISADDNDLCITLSSSVAAADWINPATNGDADLLQHVLLASRTSCHWEGNEYSQAGNHTFSHVLTSSKVGDIRGTRVAKEFNEELKVIVNPDKSAKANLPESVSFFNIDKNHLIITAIKKAEANDDIVIRLYDSEGIDSSVKLNSFFKLNNLRHTNIIEENPKSVEEINVGHHAIETFLLDATK